MLGDIVARTRASRPLVHCITNYVTANDCANLLLACGASAIMADDPEEAGEVVAACSGLTLNLGTPGARRVEAMLAAGEEANQRAIPVVFDPVGAGASGMRRKAAQEIMERVHIAIIRGNADEIATLLHGTSGRRGVDASDPAGAPEAAEANAVRLAKNTGAVVVVSGEIDVVTDGETSYRVHNGRAMMRCVTGTGCQLSALLGAYAAANRENLLQSALAAVCAMGLCGEIAGQHMASFEGNASYRNRMIDAMFHMTPECLRKGARFEGCL